MAGLRGNTAWLMANKQTAKATVVTPTATNAYKSPFAGGNISPTRQIAELSETDSSRDRGVSYVVTTGVEGTPEIYVRDGSIGFWLQAVLGSDAATGTTPNYSHVITPTTILPYITCWRNISDTLWERFEDCKVDSLTVSTEAGAPLTAAIGVQGRKSVRLTADPSGPPPTAPNILLDAATVYNYNDATVLLGGGATAVVRSFELGITNNVSQQQTDDSIPYDVVEGLREINLSFDLIFETLDEYNKFHYGGIAGTTISSSIYTTSADFSFDHGANNQVRFTLPSIAYEEFPVEPNTAGDPITVSVRAVGQRNASPIVTATIKNQIASY